MNRYHAAVWLDHATARIFHFDAHEFDVATVKSGHAGEHIHHKAGAVGSGHAADDPRFFAAIEKALDGAQEILLSGPGGTKTAFAKHAGAHAPALAKKILAVENADHPTDGEAVAHARKFFKIVDRMTPQRG